MARNLIVCFILLTAQCSYGQAKKSLDSLAALSYKFKVTEPEKAIQLAQSALKIAAGLNLGKEIMDLNYQLGLIYLGKGDYASGLKCFEKNLETAKVNRNENAIARASINIGNIYVTQGKYNSAIDHYLASVSIVEKQTDTALLHVNYLCLGIAYYYLKNFDKSLEYYQKCLDINRAKNEIDKSAYIYNAMGVIYKETGQYKKALEFLKTTQRIASSSKDSVILSHNLGNLGELYGITGDFSVAEDYIKQGLEIQRRFRDDKGMGESLVLLGNLFLKDHKVDEAISFYKEALDVSQRVGINEISKNSYKGLSNAYRQRGDFKKALDFEDRFAGVKDSLFNATGSMQIADMQTRYETDKKEQENALLVKQNDIKNLEIIQQKNQRNYLVILMVLLFFSGLLLYNRARLKNRNKVLAEKELRNRAVFQAGEKEKVELSRELHDGLGPLLSLIKLNVSTLKSMPENEKILAEIKELTNESIKEVRGISHALAPAMLQKQGLQAALTEFVNQVNSAGIISTTLNYRVSRPLSQETEINIYRIAQEAINNTIKHSGAEKASIDIYEKGSWLEFSLSDDGKGFLVDDTEKMAGNGLNNIYSRVDFMKGKLEVNSGDKKGTSYFITIPLNENANVG
jgi:two-component system, NarL family, sensor kinase